MRVLHGGKALLVGFEPFSLGDYPNLQVIGCNATSVEHLPLAECEQQGIKIVSLRGETEFLRTITSTSEHTIGLIIALLRNYKTALNGPYQERELYKGHTLAGKTLGVIGPGRVGKQVMNIAQMFGMRTISVDEESDPLAWDKLLSESDIVSIHIPLQFNEGFIRRELLSQLKPTAYVVNTSRSGVVEKGALLWALENKVIAGAAVDFVDDKELVHYARDHDNLILTSHLGGCTFEDMERTESFITAKVEEYLVENKII